MQVPVYRHSAYEDIPPHHHHHHPRRARHQVAASPHHVRAVHALHILDAPGRLSDYDAACATGKAAKAYAKEMYSYFNRRAKLNFP